MPRRLPPLRRAARFLRLASLGALALASCGEPEHATGGGTFLGRVSLVPVYPAGASIATTALAIDQVNVEITRPPGTDVLDTTIAFPPSANELSLDLTVQLTARTERLAVRLQLSGSGRLLFTGMDTVLVAALGTGPPATPNLQLSYVGPGANLAFLVLEPRDTTLSLGSQFQFRTTGSDANEQPVPEYYVRWATSGGGATVSPTGVVTAPAARGQIRLTVVTPNGVADSTTVAFAPPATSLAITGGDNQTGSAGAPLATPLTVQVRAADNLGVPGVAVHFAGVSGTTVRDPTVVTDANGNAATVGTLGPSLGLQAFDASAAGLTGVRFSAMAAAGAVAQLFIVSGSGQGAPADSGLAAPLVVGAIDQFQNPTPNVTIDWKVVSGGGTLSAASSTTDANGHAAVGYRVGPVAGLNQISATARVAQPVAPATFTATGIPGQPSFLAVVSGSGQTAIAGQVIPTAIVLAVQDSLANPVPNATVTWQLVRGAGNLSTASTVSDSRGEVQVRFTPGPAALVSSIQASIQNGPSGSTYVVPVRGVAGAAAKTSRFSGNWQQVTGGATSLPLIAAVADALDNPVSVVPIAWTSPGPGSLSSNGTQTDGRGLTSITYTSSTSPFGELVLARRTAGDSVYFTVNDGFATQINVFSGDNQTGAIGAPLAQPIAVIVRDLGQVVPGLSVGFKVVSGGGSLSAQSAITDLNGIASFSLRLGSRAGPNIVEATLGSTGRVIELGATGVAGPAAGIVAFGGDFQTGSLAQSFRPVLTVIVTDAAGNPVSGASVDWSDQSGGSEAPASSPTNAQGVASTTFTPISVGRQKVRATLTGTQTIVEFTVIVVP
jgi:Bacterial Ig-like domain (group 1)